jgi:outer membrane immunogenic protein
MRLTTALLCATALVSASAALAADLPTAKQPPAPAVVPQPAFSWTGFYLGLGGGAAFMQVKNNSYASYSSGSHGLAVGIGDKSDLGKFGTFGAIEAGADYQMDRFVVGAFTNFDFKNLSAKNSTTGYATVSGTRYSARLDSWYKVGDNWDAGVRLGYLLTNRNLLYALGGYSGAQISSGVRVSYASSSGAKGSFAASQSGWKSGYVLGAGWESAITDHVTFKVEYRYADYGKAKSSYSTSSGNFAMGQSGDISVNSVRAMLGYKF